LGPDIAVFFRVKRHKGWVTLDVKAERVAAVPRPGGGRRPPGNLAIS
jgi:hypothetical protein